MIRGHAPLLMLVLCVALVGCSWPSDSSKMLLTTTGPPGGPVAPWCPSGP
jgi:hypothetical protein